MILKSKIEYKVLISCNDQDLSVKTTTCLNDGWEISGEYNHQMCMWNNTITHMYSVPVRRFIVTCDNFGGDDNESV